MFLPFCCSTSHNANSVFLSGVSAGYLGRSQQSLMSPKLMVALRLTLRSRLRVALRLTLCSCLRVALRLTPRSRLRVALRLTLRPRQRSQQSLMASANSRIEALYLTGDSRYFLQASRQAGLIRAACDQRSFLQQSL